MTSERGDDETDEFQVNKKKATHTLSINPVV